MRITRKELAELLTTNLEMDGVAKQQLTNFYKSLEEKGRIEIEVDWTPLHQVFYEKIEKMMAEQDLEVHPKFLSRIKGWIDSAINRGGKCVMLDVRNCPCPTPLNFGCPLLRKRDTQH